VSLSDGWADERTSRAWEEQQLLIAALLKRCGGEATISCEELDPNWVHRQFQLVSNPADFMLDQVTIKLVEEQ
jgi:hypothetical protein